MKKSLCSLLLICGLMTYSLPIVSQNLFLLAPNESYKAPPNKDMIVMDANTFGSYNYAVSQYDTLKQEVVRLDSALIEHDSTEAQLTRDYKSSLFLKQSEITSYQDNYKRLQATTDDCIKHENQLQVDYRNIERKNRRLKGWRNWFMGTTALLGTIVVLSVVK